MNSTAARFSQNGFVYYELLIVLGVIAIMAVMLFLSSRMTGKTAAPPFI